MSNAVSHCGITPEPIGNQSGTSVEFPDGSPRGFPPVGGNPRNRTAAGTTKSRWLVYRDRYPLGTPLYLGQVDATDADDATRLGSLSWNCKVVVQPSGKRDRHEPISTAKLEKALRAVERRRNSHAGRQFRRSAMERGE